MTNKQANDILKSIHDKKPTQLSDAFSDRGYLIGLETAQLIILQYLQEHKSRTAEDQEQIINMRKEYGL